jgi:hypothetical protein
MPHTNQYCTCKREQPVSPWHLGNEVYRQNIGFFFCLTIHCFAEGPHWGSIQITFCELHMSHTFRSLYNDTRYSYTYLYVRSLINDIQAMRFCVMCCPVQVFVFQWPDLPSNESNCIRKDTCFDLILNPNSGLMNKRWIITTRRWIMAEYIL